MFGVASPGAGTSYVSAGAVEAAADGYTAQQMRDQWHSYYTTNVNNGVLKAYEFTIAEGEIYIHLRYPDGSTASTHITYTPPYGMTPANPVVSIPYTLHWTRNGFDPVGFLAAIQILVFAGNDQAAMSQVGGEVISLTDTDDLSGVFTLALSEPFHHVHVYVFGGNSLTGHTLGYLNMFQLYHMP
jgi:hypothetical protein